MPPPGVLRGTAAGRRSRSLLRAMARKAPRCIRIPAPPPAPAGPPPEPPPPPGPRPHPHPGPRRSFFVTWAVAQRMDRPDLVGDHLDLRSLVPFGGLPAALLEPTGHDDPATPAQALGRVLGHLAPAHDVEEGRRLLPLLGLAVLPPAVHREPEAGRGLPGIGESELGVPGDVAHQGHGVAVRHWSAPPRAGRRGGGPPAGHLVRQPDAPCAARPRRPGPTPAPSRPRRPAPPSAR